MVPANFRSTIHREHRRTKTQIQTTMSLIFRPDRRLGLSTSYIAFKHTRVYIVFRVLPTLVGSLIRRGMCRPAPDRSGG